MKRANEGDKSILILVGAPHDAFNVVDPDARKLITQWTEMYIKDANVYILPVIRCPTPTGTPTKNSVVCCQRYLRDDLAEIAPDVIICLGKHAAIPFGLDGKESELLNRVYEVAPIRARNKETGGTELRENAHPAKLIITHAPSKFVPDYKIRSSVEAAFRQADRLASNIDIKPPDKYYLIESPEEFEEWVNRHITDKRLNRVVHAFDIETNGRELHPKTKFSADHPPVLRCVSFSWGKGMAICVPYERDPEAYHPILKKFMESNVQFIGHNVSYDYFFLRIVNNILTKNLIGDTMLMASMLNPGKGKYGYGLKPLAAELTDLGGYETDMKSIEDEVEDDPDNPKKKRILVSKWEKVDMEVMAPYNCADADATLQIYHIFYKIMKERNMLVAHWIMSNALIPVGEMEHNGFLIDTEWVKESTKIIEGFVQQYIKEMRDILGMKPDEPDYEWNSPCQLGGILYDILKYPVPEGIMSMPFDQEDGGDPSRPTNDEALSIINTPFTQTVRKYRRASKLLATYFKGYLVNHGLDNRLRADFNLVGTITGRLSSSGDANLQNIPSGMAHTEPGYEDLHDFKAKKAFIPRPGWKIVNADQSQLELRIAGAVSREEKFIKSYKNLIDMHSRNAIVSFGLQIDTTKWEEEAIAKGMKRGTEEFDVYVEREQCRYVKKHYPEERQAAKTVSFGILYGMSKYGLAQNLNANSRESGGKAWTIEECDSLIKKFKQGYPTLTNWQNGLVRHAHKYGYTPTCFGRRRYLPLIDSKVYREKATSERHAINTPVQSAGSDFMMAGIINMHQRLDPEKFIFVATVHDSVVCEVREDYIEEFVQITKECLETPKINGVIIPLCEIMPFVAEFEVGDSYGTMEGYP